MLKAEISLKIANKNLNFLADQTPTPTTRLIKNCEEVGLFDDLAEVNPFDVTFRKAVENISNNNEKKSIDSTISVIEESLNTPRIIHNSKRVVHENTGKSEQTIENSNSVSKPCNSTSKKSTNKNLKKDISTGKVNKKFRPLLPKETVIVSKTGNPTLISLNFESCVVDKPLNQFPLQISKEKPTLTKIIDSKHKLLECLSKKSDLKDENITLSNRLNVSNGSQTCSATERKRFASMRYRQKRNKEMLELKKRNSELLGENLHLKEKLTYLQNMLSTHHMNCSLFQEELQKNSSNILTKKSSAIQIPASTVLLKIPKIIVEKHDDCLGT